MMKLPENTPSLLAAAPPLSAIQSLQYAAMACEVKYILQFISVDIIL
jgi:hypothetical protein